VRNKISQFHPNGQSNGEVELTTHFVCGNAIKMKANSLLEFSGNQFKPNSGPFSSRFLFHNGSNKYSTLPFGQWGVTQGDSNRVTYPIESSPEASEQIMYFRFTLSPSISAHTLHWSHRKGLAHF